MGLNQNNASNTVTPHCNPQEEDMAGCILLQGV